MENSSPLILEVSSDEEAGFSDTSGGVFTDSEDHDWLSELLGEVDDSDDILSDVFPNPAEKSILQHSKSPAKVVDEECASEDDDCVVLECDPEKPLSVGNGRADDEGDDSDDLEIVGEKGEIACRDFPHPRHLCVTYLFASTRHEVHCSQCHCYVCDTIAPCSNWGAGTSSIDHCHATDKVEFWRTERKSKKEPAPNRVVTPVIPCISNTEVPAISRAQPNYVLPNHIVTPVVFHPCSVSSNARMPHVVNQGKHHLLGNSVYKPQPQLVSAQLHSAYNSYNAVNRSSRFFPSFKRPGFVGASPNNRFRYYRSYNGSQLSKDSSQRRFHPLPAARLNGYHFPNQQRINNRVGNPMFSQLDSSTPLNNDVPPIHSPPISSYLVQDSATHVQFPFQMNLNSNDFVNVGPFQPQVASQPIMASFENMILSHPQTHASNQSDAGNAFAYMGNSTFENQSPQTRSYNNIYPAIINGQNDFQQGGQTQSGLDMIAADFGFNWDASHCHGNFQHQNVVLASNSQNLSVLEEDHHHKVAPVANSSVLDATDCHFSGIISTEPLDVPFDDWVFENPSSPSPGAFEVPLSPLWNVSSPEPAFTDAGNLFGI